MQNKVSSVIKSFCLSINQSIYLPAVQPTPIKIPPPYFYYILSTTAPKNGIFIFSKKMFLLKKIIKKHVSGFLTFLKIQLGDRF